MNTHSCSTSGRRLFVPGAALRWPIAALLCAFAVIAGTPSSFADPSPDPDLAQSVAAHEEGEHRRAETGEWRH